MHHLWNDQEAAGYDGLVEQCVYASRLLGADRAVVSYGGGNSSIKQREQNVHGDPLDVMYVKGSGSDLATITRDGFTALDLERVRRLAELDTLADTAMLAELRGARLDPDAPSPSVESILHAVIPAPAVLHTHPNAVLALTDTADGERRIREIYGDRVVVVPYAMPGFRAGRQAAAVFRDHATDRTEGVVLLHHGLFTFGATPREAYDRMVTLVSIADDVLAVHAAAGRSPRPATDPPAADRVGIAALRRAISDAAGRPCIVRRHVDPSSWAFSQRPDVADVSQRGVATPDHAIWTKPLPMLGRQVDAFAAAYSAYFHAHAAGRALRMLDPAPRVVIDPELGLFTAGPNLTAQAAAADIYLQTIDTIERAEGIGGYRALPPADVFDLEYWELEQRKLDRGGAASEFTGEVALVTGANSGIGRGCALALLDRGAAVVGLDINPAVAGMTDHPAYIGIACDQTSGADLDAAIDRGVELFGGVDLVVAAAGVFPESSPIAAHNPAAWRTAMSVNVDGLVQLLAAVHPLLVLAPKGGRVVVIGSKNVAAPGPGASAYSASKTAANQIARVAALEWAADGIRVNSVHPDAVFDTALWKPELLAERAERYGLTIEQYKRRNLMGVEITSAAVGDLVASMLGSAFRCTTGAHVSIDGGNERTI
jgi:rhamnose utilization protein RhaD (predicted bifunctional aldolase and dehydrogenase)/NAD(P)-dependent dehydrogenase (short-subunit alcohol dehydrogenase family)